VRRGFLLRRDFMTSERISEFIEDYGIFVAIGFLVLGIVASILHWM